MSKESKEANAEALAAAQAAHVELIEKLDNHSVHKTFRNPHWRPNQRRNKNIKTILGDASRKEASVIATPQDHSGAVSPSAGAGPGAVGAAAAAGGGGDDGLSTSGTSTPAVPSSAAGTANLQPNLAQASRSLTKLVLEKSLRSTTTGGGSTLGVPGSYAAPSATYTNIESAPSMAPQKRYCDITGLPSSYTDPKTRLRYYNGEVFGMIRAFPQGVAEQFLEARNAHTVLK